MHRITYEKEPMALSKYMHQPQIGIRTSQKPSVAVKSNMAKTKNSFFHRVTYLYNQIPDIIKYDEISIYGQIRGTK